MALSLEFVTTSIMNEVHCIRKSNVVQKGTNISIFYQHFCGLFKCSHKCYFIIWVRFLRTKSLENS